jgi:hypothetical protein
MLRPSISVVAMSMTACLGVASTDLPAPAKSLPTISPSRLDYLVLASMADSLHPLSMAATYRPNP